MDTFDIGRHSRVTIERFKSLEEKLQSLENLEYPTEGSLMLSMVLRNFCEVAISSIVGYSEHYLAEQDDDMPEVFFENYMLAHARLVQFVRFVETSRITDNPIAIIGPLESILRKIHNDTRLIIRPQSEYMYETWFLLEEISKAAIDIGSPLYTSMSMITKPEDSPENIVVLNYPASEKENVLLHALFGHEIGHFAVDKHKLVDDLEIGTKRDALIEKYYGITAQLGDKDRLITDFSNWLTEILSDIVGCRLFGPAFFLAFDHFCIVESTYYSTIAHKEYKYQYPPLAIRTEVILKELNQYVVDQGNSHDSRTQKLFEPFLKYAKRLPWETSIENLDYPEKKHDLVTWSSVKLALEDRSLLSKVDSIVQGQEYSPAIFFREVPILLERMQNEIIPNEVGFDSTNGRKSANWISILNAAWAYYYSVLDLDEFAKPDKIEELFSLMHESSRHVLRAIELSEIQKFFEAEREIHEGHEDLV